MNFRGRNAVRIRVVVSEDETGASQDEISFHLQCNLSLSMMFYASSLLLCLFVKESNGIRVTRICDIVAEEPP